MVMSDFKEEQVQETTEKSGEQAATLEICQKLLNVFSSQSEEKWHGLVAFSKALDGELLDTFVSYLQDKVDDPSVDQEERDKILLLRHRLQQIRANLAKHMELLRSYLRTKTDRQEDFAIANFDDLDDLFFLSLRGWAEVSEDTEEKEQIRSAAQTLTRLVDSIALRNDLQAPLQTLQDLSDSDRERLAQGLGQPIGPGLDGILPRVPLEFAGGAGDPFAGAGRVADPLDDARLARQRQLEAQAFYGEQLPFANMKECKEAQYELYKKFTDFNVDTLPAEYRILGHLATIKDVDELKLALADAFIPGPEYVSDGMMYLSTTPDALLKAIDRLEKIWDTKIKTNPGLKKLFRKGYDMEKQLGVVKRETLKMM